MAHDRMRMFREADFDVESVEGLDVAARRRVGKVIVDIEHGTRVVTVTKPRPWCVDNFGVTSSDLMFTSIPKAG